MSQVPPSMPQAQPRPVDVDRNLQGEYTLDTRTSTYDKFNAFLISSITIVGTLVFLGILIWLTLFEWGTPTRTVAMEEMIGNEDRPEGVADDWQEPGVEEFPEVEQPQLADAIEALTDAVSSVRAQVEEYDGNAVKMGTGTGLGDERERGSGRGNARAIPEAQRWRIQYSAKTLGEYAKQLEYFEVELGAVSKTTARIDLISNLMASKPSLSFTDRSSEKRLYFSYRASRLKKWDQFLAKKAGVGDITQRIIVQFYEEPVRAQLRQLEKERFTSDGKSLMEVKKTHFRVRPKGNGFEYYVHRIEYRPLPNQA